MSPADAIRAPAPLSIRVDAPPSPELSACVILPARDEQRSIADCLQALRAQRDADGSALDRRRYEIIVLANNCRDRTAAIARRPALGGPPVHVVEVRGEAIHVGAARRALMDEACRRLLAVDRPGAMIASTDADSRVASDWVVANQKALQGVDAVGGRVSLAPQQRAALPRHARRAFLRDIAYRRAICELDALLDPIAHDPFPRHHQHYGASLAVRARAYRACGGMPPVESSEDVALYEALLRAGHRVRHAPEVKVETSARLDGRAPDGMADALRLFHGDEALVDRAPTHEKRARARGALRRAWRAHASAPAWIEAPGALAGWSIDSARLRELWAREAHFGGIEVALARSEYDPTPEPISAAIEGLRLIIARLRADRSRADEPT